MGPEIVAFRRSAKRCPVAASSAAESITYPYGETVRERPAGRTNGRLEMRRSASRAPEHGPGISSPSAKSGTPARFAASERTVTGKVLSPNSGRYRWIGASRSMRPSSASLARTVAVRGIAAS